MRKAVAKKVVRPRRNRGYDKGFDGLLRYVRTKGKKDRKARRITRLIDQFLDSMLDFHVAKVQLEREGFFTSAHIRFR